MKVMRFMIRWKFKCLSAFLQRASALGEDVFRSMLWPLRANRVTILFKEVVALANSSCKVSSGDKGAACAVLENATDRPAPDLR